MGAGSGPLECHPRSRAGLWPVRPVVVCYSSGKQPGAVELCGGRVGSCGFEGTRASEGVCGRRDLGGPLLDAEQRRTAASCRDLTCKQQKPWGRDALAGAGGVGSLAPITSALQPGADGAGGFCCIRGPSMAFHSQPTGLESRLHGSNNQSST